MSHLGKYYLVNMKVSILQQLQYRVSNYFYMVGMVAEPVIYLVVWSSVANSQGGSIGGYTAGAFTAYYIVWTLVRNMNIVLTPYAWEARIQRGQLSAELLRPIHPLHSDIAYFAGWKVVVIIMWLPLAFVLSLIFKPTFNPSLLQGVVFFFAIWGAFLTRMMMLWLLGMIAFWTTRVGAIYELFFAFELIFSGRLVPMPLMPLLVQQIANFLPFQWTFYFPIDSLVGNLTTQQLLFGLGMQVLWIVTGVVCVNIVWHYGIRRFSSVGN